MVFVSCTGLGGGGGIGERVKDGSPQLIISS